MLTGKVGVAPGTTTMRFWNPYASVADMRGGLGIIDPSDYRMTARTGRAAMAGYNPNDRWWTGPRGPRLPGTVVIQVGPTGHAEGLVGHGLGMTTPFINRTLSDAYLPAFPGSSVDDFSLARMYQYQPVESGWVHVQDVPTGPTSGLGQAPPLTPPPSDKSYKLQVVTTVAISALALAGVVTFVQDQLKRRRGRSR